MKVAIIVDWLNIYGGAEKVLEALLEIYSDAHVYCAVHDEKKLPKSLKGLKVTASFIQRLPFGRSKYRNYLPLMPLAFEQFDLRGYDLVISSSHAFAKGVITGPDTCHICYCLTPMRWAWDMYHDYLENEKIRGFKKKVLAAVLNYLRIWDVTSSNRVDYFVAISHHISDRISKYYGRKSTVIYPPVETAKFSSGGGEKDYYLAVSRLVSQKKTDIIIQAFNELKLPLKVIGKGRDSDMLKKMAGPNIEFLGYRSSEDISSYMRDCKAFVFASYEDFGIVPLEAAAAGVPSIVYGAGGSLETVIDGKTGIYFEEQTKDSIIASVKRFEKTTFNSNEIIQFAKGFDREVFKQKMKVFVQEKMEEFRRKRDHAV